MKDALSKMKDSKNMTFFIIGGILVFICIVIIIYFSFFYNVSNYSGDLRNTVKNAAVKYCNDNCDNLFEGVSSIKVPASTLIDGGYMKSFASLTHDKNSTCSGEVVINKSYNGYNYITTVDCNDIDNKNIYDEIVNSNSIVTSGSGLYEMNDSKVFRGEYTNNYLKLGNILFRIVKLNNDNTIMLILSDYNKNTLSKWDDRYNSSVKRSDGINDYSISRVRESLLNLLSNVYGENINNKAISHDYCIGSRSANDNNNDGSIECSNKYNDYISLLPVYDFINASIDSNCVSIKNSRVCQNYNYLAGFEDSFWTITPVKGSSSEVYYSNGYYLNFDSAKTKYSLRFVITISGDEIYKSGDGTLDNPYVIFE